MEKISTDSPSDMNQDEQEYPYQGRKQNIGGKIRSQKLACFAAIGLAHKHQHRGGEGGGEFPKTIDIDDGNCIEYDVEQSPHPTAYLSGKEREHDTGQIVGQEQFKIDILIEGGPLMVGQGQYGAQHTQHIHRHEEDAVSHDRL
ncbi:hypothetical protein HMPREF1870_00431 [Bacteroidales bacterium KA00344]|nr:hypothetical protein HMPREF1870_00431 [Bacteroidales bacterium KA00344]